MRLVVAAAVASALVPARAFAVDYMTGEQAAKSMFADADRFEAREVELDAAELGRLAAAGVPARSAHWPVQVAKKADATLGYVVIDNVVGKFELITYAVGIDRDGA